MILGRLVDVGESVILLCPVCVNALDLRVPEEEWITLFQSEETEDDRDLDAPDPGDTAFVCKVCSRPVSVLVDCDEGYVPRKACPECAEALRVAVDFALEQPRES